ncbi:MAG: methyltransferase domain-containing protein [Lachnospiraceae bacterium]|nr:methyltransferase domain-containing protein [Lachnospiraceae bacterium]
MYTIKQAAEILNCRANAIRFYEKKELIKPVRGENQYRFYEESDIQKLQFIMLYRKLGFSIEAIKKLCENQNETALDIYTTQFNLINEHIHAMTEIRNALGETIDELLEHNSESEETKVQLDKTTKLIAEMNAWSDEWNFDSWAPYYDKSIRTYEDGLNFYKHYDTVMEMTAKAAVSNPGKIAEIGIGTGNLTMAILKTDRVQAGDIIGIDQSVNMLKEAKKKLPDVRMRVGTFLQLPLNENSYDTIVTSYAFHHCKEGERKLALKEMDRVLKQHGRIVIADLMFADDKAKKTFLKNCTKREREDVEDEYFANVDEMQRLCKEAGYEFKATQIDELIWVIEAEK